MGQKRCGKLGHRKVDCTQKESTLLAAWGDSDADSNDSDEEDNVVAQMAIADTTTENQTIQDTTAEVCYLANEGSQRWILDSGCLHHMTGNKSLFLDLHKADKGNVSFGDNRSCKILGVGKVGNK
ncbi:hypothetical protein LINGRAHAP2_LOCUS8115, partial [Linum grandiflorum]